MALSKKRAILSTCSLHVEFIQILTLVVLAATLFLKPIQLYKFQESLDPRDRTFLPIRLSQGRHKNNVTMSLVDHYRRLFKDSVNHHIVEVPEEKMTSPYLFYNGNREKSVIGATFNAPSNGSYFKATAWYLIPDNRLFLAKSVTAIMNTFLSYFTKSEQYYMRTSHLPHSSSSHEYEAAEYIILRNSRFYCHHTSFMQAVSMLMIPYFLVLERKKGSKHLQYLSGTSPVLYWCMNFVFDLATYVFLSCFYLIVAFTFDVPEIIEQLEIISIVGLLNGVMMLPYIYVLQIPFDAPSSAAFVISLLNYLLGDPESIVQIITGPRNMMFRLVFDNFLYLMFPSYVYPDFIFHQIKDYRLVKLCPPNKDYCNSKEDRYIRKYCCKLLCDRGQCPKGNGHLQLNLRSRLVWRNLHAKMLLIFLIWSAIFILIESGVICSVQKYFHRQGKSFASSLRMLAKGQVKEKELKQIFQLSRLFYRQNSSAIFLSECTDMDPGVAQELLTVKDALIWEDEIRLIDVQRKEGAEPIISNMNLHIEKCRPAC